MDKEKIKVALEKLPLYSIGNKNGGVLVFKANPKTVLFFGEEEGKVTINNPVYLEIVLGENDLALNVKSRSGEVFNIKGEVYLLGEVTYEKERFLRIYLDDQIPILISYKSNNNYNNSSNKLFEAFHILKAENFSNKIEYHFKAKINQFQTTLEDISLDKGKHYDIMYAKYNSGKENLKISYQGNYECSFYGNFVMEYKFRHNGMGRLNILFEQNNNKTQLDLFELTAKEFNSGISETEKLEEERKNKTKKRESNMNKAFNSFMPSEIPERTIALTMEGKIALRSNDGTFVSFDKETKTLVNHMNMVFGEDKVQDLGFIMPVNKNQVKVGDVVLIGNTFGFVSEVVKDEKVENSGLKVVDILTNSESNIVDTKNRFINAPTIKKVVTFFDMSGGASTDSNMMSGINPMMFMMMGKGRNSGDKNDMLKMMMMQMMGGTNGAGNGEINPMMMMMFMDK